MSRSDRPKQLLPLVRGKSLLQLSYERLRGLLPTERIFVCTGAAHGPAVLDNLSELPRENLLGEPTGRDTANAVGFPAAVLHHRDRDAVMAIVTADHVIAPVEKFQAAIRTAFDESHAAAIAFLKANADAVLTEPCKYGRDARQETVGGVFFHLVEHEIHHRAFILYKLRTLQGAG